MLNKITIYNTKIEKILSKISQNIFTREKLQKITETCKTQTSDLFKDDHPVSDSYFHKAYQHQDPTAFNVPRAAYLSEKKHDIILHKNLNKGMLQLQRSLCAQFNPLGAFYPKEGFIGWHHNGDASGFNIIFTYSQDGKGDLRYYDYKSKSIVKMHDDIGWTVKIGYFPSIYQEPENVFWHAAETVNERITIAFIIPRKELWIAMLEDITDGKYDKAILNEGPKAHK